ncbi:MAG: sigma-70 family RNA polymerase sigma factor [Symploca sp. SIO1B1]|nr:sigma-70 family RNA polymerase sigma factor [Symploca sp. SIO1B1]
MKSSDIRGNGDSILMGTAAEDTVSEFWQQWHSLQDQLYRCCLKLMNFNATDAEDALSQAMLKAWEKVQKYAGKIDNLKAWLMQLTRNFCIDIIRQRAKGAAGVESLEWVGATDNVDTTSAVDTPEKALEKAEKATVIEEAIASLPERLRDTFILHFYQQRSHTEIAEVQGITYDNVCKRISLARKQLKEMLSSYFHGIDEDNQQQKAGEKAIAQKDSTYHVGIIAQKKNFDPSPRPQVSASVLTTGHPPDMISAVDQKETGVIALLEGSAESKSKSAIVNPNPPEITDEENQQKKEPLVVAIASFEVAAVETREAGAMASIEESAQEKKSKEAIALNHEPDKTLGAICLQQRFAIAPILGFSCVEPPPDTIASLPERLRDTFILRFYHQQSQTEIAQAQGITYDNVCKRISLAGKQLKEKLSSYFLSNDSRVVLCGNSLGSQFRCRPI